MAVVYTLSGTEGTELSDVITVNTVFVLSAHCLFRISFWIRTMTTMRMTVTMMKTMTRPRTKRTSPRTAAASPAQDPQTQTQTEPDQQSPM